MDCGFTSHYRSIEVVGEIGGAFVPPLFSLPRQASHGELRNVGHWRGLVRRGAAGMARQGEIWLGTDRQGVAGRARRGWAGLAMVRRVWAGQGRQGMECYDRAS